MPWPSEDPEKPKLEGGKNSYYSTKLYTMLATDTNLTPHYSYFILFCSLHVGCIPRYVRINRLKTSVEDVIQEFTQNGYEQLHQQNVASYVAQVSSSVDV